MADGRWRWAWCAVPAVVVAAVLGSAVRANAVGALADPDARKAATKCQALIAKTTAKALATKLKAYNACSAAAFACVQTKSGKADCPTKAAATCTKKLSSAATAAVKAKEKIVANTSCLALSTADLLGSDGLGFGDIAGQCSADFGINVCEGLEPIADCLITSHDRDAGALIARGLPRTGEMLGALPGAPLANTNGLPVVPGCTSCQVQDSEQKGVEKCAKALGGGTHAVAAALEAAFGACTLDVYECVQAKGETPACLASASTACTKAAAKVTKAVAKLGAVTTKGCGGVPFVRVTEAGGLNFDALAPRCAALGIVTLDGPTAIASCLAAESKCAVARLVQTALPRTKEFLDAAQAGGLAADLAATCPTATGLQTASTLKSFRAAGNPRGVFGTILKLVKSVKRTVPSAVATKTSGGKPTPSGNTTSGVSKVNGPKKVTFGSVHKYTVTYHGNRSRAGGGGRGGEEPPNLIVTVSRDDIVLDDHFEIPTLTLPMDGTDVDDELDIEFADSIPACAFDLEFATKTGDGVSGYTALPQVVEEDEIVTGPAAELVSRSTAGSPQQDGDFDGSQVAISANGRWVAFSSNATDLIAPADTNGHSDVFVRDRCVADGVPVAGCTPATTRASTNPGGEEFHDGAAGRVGISDDGRYVAYTVFRNDDPNPPIVQAFMKDRCDSDGVPVDDCSAQNTDLTFDGESMSSGGNLTALSSDGRFVVFTSATSFNVGTPSVFLLDTCNSSRDPVFGGCEPFLDSVSDASVGGVPNGASDFGAVSRNGRFVAFRSDASDILATGDTNAANDVFLHDHCLDPATGTNFPGCVESTVRVNLAPGGVESAGDDPTTLPLTNVAVSDDGRYVAYSSTASDLLGAGVDTNGKRDIFVYDRCLAHGAPVDGCTPANERVNVGPNGSASNGDLPSGFAISMSANGRLVVFASDATNLVGPAVGTPNGLVQVFMRDRCLDAGAPITGCTPATTILSLAPDRGLGIAPSDRPAIAAGGSATAFGSASPNLLGPGVDTNGKVDVFVRDR